MNRFWSKVDKTDDCWLWTASKDGRGYGHFWYEGHLRQAHRVAYEFVVGPIPDNCELDHLCRVRDCVRPDHLEPVTHRENVLRGELNTRQKARTHCVNGHEFSEANTRLYRGGRVCRACDRARRNSL